MTSFSSCYFCGTALDASVAEQPVVPADLSPSGGSGRTVTLCPACSRKLDAVMDEVRAAIREAGADVSAGSADDAARAPDEAAGAPDAAARSPDAAAGQGAGDDIAVDSDVDLDAATAEEFFEEAEVPGEESDSASGPAPDADANGGAEPTRGQGSNRSEQSGQGNPGDETAEDDEGTAKQTISALENSKVMRMLENREFPVERESFQVVAANAYGVTPSDVGKVIDMAIDRGLLAERDGQLVRP